MGRVLETAGSLGSRWQSWAAVAVICFALEAGALYYQQSLLYFPCELCIYARVWLAAIGLVALAGLVLRHAVWWMRALILVEIALVLGLGRTVWKLLAIDYGFAGVGACSLYARFPEWAPLDLWFPAMFRVQGPCGETPEVVLGLSMADGLAVTTLGFLLAFAIALAGSFVRPPRPDPATAAG